MFELDTLATKVRTHAGLEDSVVLMLQGIADRIEACAGRATELAALVAGLRAKDNVLAAAIVKNTTPSPLPDTAAARERAGRKRDLSGAHPNWTDTQLEAELDAQEAAAPPKDATRATRKRALEVAHPGWTDRQVEAELDSQDAETKKAKETAEAKRRADAAHT